MSPTLKLDLAFWIDELDTLIDEVDSECLIQYLMSMSISQMQRWSIASSAQWEGMSLRPGSRG